MGKFRFGEKIQIPNAFQAFSSWMGALLSLFAQITDLKETSLVVVNFHAGLSLVFDSIGIT